MKTVELRPDSLAARDRLSECSVTAIVNEETGSVNLTGKIDFGLVRLGDFFLDCRDMHPSPDVREMAANINESYTVYDGYDDFNVNVLLDMVTDGPMWFYQPLATKMRRSTYSYGQRASFQTNFDFTLKNGDPCFVPMGRPRYWMPGYACSDSLFVRANQKTCKVRFVDRVIRRVPLYYVGLCNASPVTDAMRLIRLTKFAEVSSNEMRR